MAEIDPIITIRVPAPEPGPHLWQTSLPDFPPELCPPFYRFDDMEKQDAFNMYWYHMRRRDKDWLRLLAAEKTSDLIDWCPRLAPWLVPALAAQILGSDTCVHVTQPETISNLIDRYPDHAFWLPLAAQIPTPGAVHFPLSLMRVAFEKAAHHGAVTDSPDRAAWEGISWELPFLFGVAAYVGADSETFRGYVVAELFGLYSSAVLYSQPWFAIGDFLKHIISENREFRTALFATIPLRRQFSPESYGCFVFQTGEGIEPQSAENQSSQLSSFNIETVPPEHRAAAIHLLAGVRLTAEEDDRFVLLLYDCLRNETDETDPVAERRVDPAIREAALRALCVHPNLRDYPERRAEVVRELTSFVNRPVNSFHPGLILRALGHLNGLGVKVAARRVEVLSHMLAAGEELLKLVESGCAPQDIGVLPDSKNLYALRDMLREMIKHDSSVAPGNENSPPPSPELLVAASKVLGLAVADAGQPPRAIEWKIFPQILSQFPACPAPGMKDALPHLIVMAYCERMPDVVRSHLLQVCRAVDDTADAKTCAHSYAVIEKLTEPFNNKDAVMMSVLGNDERCMEELTKGAEKMLADKVRKGELARYTKADVKGLVAEALLILCKWAATKPSFRPGRSARDFEHWSRKVRRHALVDAYKSISRKWRLQGAPKSRGKVLTSTDAAANNLQEKDFLQEFEAPEADGRDIYRGIAAKKTFAKIAELVQVKLGRSGPRARQILELMLEGIAEHGHVYTQDEIGARLGVSREVPSRLLKRIREVVKSEFGEDLPF
jgi:hypothetical protein